MKLLPILLLMLVQETPFTCQGYTGTDPCLCPSQSATAQWDTTQLLVRMDPTQMQPLEVLSYRLFENGLPVWSLDIPVTSFTLVPTTTTCYVATVQPILTRRPPTQHIELWSPSIGLLPVTYLIR